MSGGWAVETLGIIAGLCTTGSFVPQVVKTWREGETGAISTRMYVIISVAFVLWLSYGVVIGSWPMIVFNILNLGLGGMILAMKFRAASRHSFSPAGVADFRSSTRLGCVNDDSQVPGPKH
jgi:MtN3 and saliva related transmembrane protein